MPSQLVLYRQRQRTGIHDQTIHARLLAEHYARRPEIFDDGR